MLHWLQCVLKNRKSYVGKQLRRIHELRVKSEHSLNPCFNNELEFYSEDIDENCEYILRYKPGPCIDPSNWAYLSGSWPWRHIYLPASMVRRNVGTLPWWITDQELKSDQSFHLVIRDGVSFDQKFSSCFCSNLLDLVTFDFLWSFLMVWFCSFWCLLQTKVQNLTMFARLQSGSWFHLVSLSCIGIEALEVMYNNGGKCGNSPLG